MFRVMSAGGSALPRMSLPPPKAISLPMAITFQQFHRGHLDLDQSPPLFFGRVVRRAADSPELTR
jgi:hypothetical protein